MGQLCMTMSAKPNLASPIPKQIQLCVSNKKNCAGSRGSDLSVASSALSSRKVSIYFPNSKIDPLTRRLQLVDATGGIDVLIPDLPLNWNSNDIFEVTFLFVSALPSLLGSLIGV
ncbi:hypothetical protein P8452_02954 [Trifolium repens]|nr:hypothetical protein P8452_02954 [Trifolium repens]